MSALYAVDGLAIQRRPMDVPPGLDDTAHAARSREAPSSAGLGQTGRHRASQATSIKVVNDGIPFYINPDTFDFKAGPEGSNWQETTCVLIRFGHGAPLQPRTWIDVGVIVTAPLKLRDGRDLSKREAQLDSANAASAAAGIIVGMLDTGALIPSEAQPRFVGFMGGAMLASGLGYRVKGCRPTSPRNAAEPEAAESL